MNALVLPLVRLEVQTKTIVTMGLHNGHCVARVEYTQSRVANAPDPEPGSPAEAAAREVAEWIARKMGDVFGLGDLHHPDPDDAAKN